MCVPEIFIIRQIVENLIPTSLLWMLTYFELPHDKTNTTTVRPAKTQISLSLRPVWSESSLSAQWVAKDPSFLHADSEDSDQTGWMPRLIWVFAGRTCHFFFFFFFGFVMRWLVYLLWSLIHFFFLNIIFNSKARHIAFSHVLNTEKIFNVI